MAARASGKIGHEVHAGVLARLVSIGRSIDGILDVGLGPADGGAEATAPGVIEPADDPVSRESLPLQGLLGVGGIDLDTHVDRCIVHVVLDAFPMDDRCPDYIVFSQVEDAA